MVGDRIKELRQSLRMTQQEFADKLGVKRNTIATYETGRNAPIDAVFSLICHEFNVSDSWLRSGEGEMFVPRNRNQALQAYVNECMKEPESFKAMFIERMARLTDEQWKQLSEIIDTLCDEKK